LKPAQQWLLQTTLGLEPAPAEEKPARPNREDKWRLNTAAARQFHTRESHLTVPRKHVERMDIDGEAVDTKLGTWLDNTRRRANKPTPQRRNDLDDLGMRW
jgi:hypothetical protein